MISMFRPAIEKGTDAMPRVARVRLLIDRINRWDPGASPEISVSAPQVIDATPPEVAVHCRHRFSIGDHERSTLRLDQSLIETIIQLKSTPAAS